MSRQVVVTQTESWYIDKEFYPAYPMHRDGSETVVQTIWEPVEMYFDDDDDMEEVSAQYVWEHMR